MGVGESGLAVGEAVEEMPLGETVAGGGVNKEAAVAVAATLYKR